MRGLFCGGRGGVWTLAIAVFGSLLVERGGSSASADIQMVFEVPAAFQKVSGIGLISGWAFSTLGTAVTVSMQIDSNPATIIPCCGERQDVANANGPLALQSGFGQLYNFNTLSSGNHTIALRVSDGVSEMTQSHQIAVVSPGEFEFLDDLNLAQATAEMTTSQEVAITGAHAIDKATQQDQEVNLRLAWQRNSQTFIIVDSVNTGLPVPAARFHDNGDGTVTDTETNLMWEKKTNLDAFPNFANLHDANNTYDWETANDAWINAVNAEGGTGFARYNDWRVPTRQELQRIVDDTRFHPSIDPEFGPTRDGYYWTSTPFVHQPDYAAWLVDFGRGEVLERVTRFELTVRAVRGGQP